MKKIPLSTHYRRHKVNEGLYALVDDADYKWLKQYNWTAVSASRKNGGYAMRTEYGKTILMHRAIMDAKDGEEVDHKDGRGLNNQRDNLRKATRKQNGTNRGINKNNKTGFKGVSLDPTSGKWRMSIHFLFDTPEAAAHAWDQCARILHGEFARLNFPDDSVKT